MSRFQRTWVRPDGTVYHVWIRYGGVIDAGIFRRQDRICFGTPENEEIGSAPIREHISLDDLTERELEELLAKATNER